MKKRFIILSFSLVMAMIMLGTITYAFFTYILHTPPIIIKTGNVSFEASIYYGIDSDLDGRLDEVENPYQEISRETGIVQPKTVPGRTFTYKIVMKNTGNVAAKPVLYMDLFEGLLAFNHEKQEYENMLVYLFSFENIHYKIYQDNPEESSYITKDSGMYMLDHVRNQKPFFSLEEGKVKPNENIEIIINFSCLTLSEIQKYINLMTDIALPEHFMNELNYQIYFENKQGFKIKQFRVGMQSTV